MIFQTSKSRNFRVKDLWGLNTKNKQMKFLKYIICLILLNSNAKMCSQNNTERRWLIIVADDKNLSFKQQFEWIEAEKESAIERRIGVMQWTDDYIIPIFNSPTKSIEPSDYLKRKISNEKKFEVILVGLDGGIKLRQDQPATTDKLFSLIDSMPMRQHEMRQNKR